MARICPLCNTAHRGWQACPMDYGRARTAATAGQARGEAGRPAPIGGYVRPACTSCATLRAEVERLRARVVELEAVELAGVELAELMARKAGVPAKPGAIGVHSGNGGSGKPGRRPAAPVPTASTAPAAPFAGGVKSSRAVPIDKALAPARGSRSGKRTAAAIAQERKRKRDWMRQYRADQRAKLAGKAGNGTGGP